MASGGQKSEKATPKRLHDARKKGDVATSPELTAAVLALVSLFALQQQGGHILDGLTSLLARDLAGAATAPELTTATVGGRLRSDMLSGMMLLIPLAAIAVVGGLVVGFLNTRGLFSLKKAAPSFHKLNALSNAKHLVGKEALILLFKALVKVVLAIAIVKGWTPTWQSLLPSMPLMATGPVVTTVWGDMLAVVLQILLVYALIGAVDFGYRQFSFSRRMRMTKQDVKDEAKQSEGNPQMRARIRAAGRKRVRSMMGGNGLRRVPEADVIVTNPTHFAVAIQYSSGKMRAPKVIAKGQNLIALRIKDAARGHNIPIVENKPLAQALFKSVAVGQEVPPDLYQAVAQVLAFVYRMRAPAQRRLAANR